MTYEEWLVQMPDSLKNDPINSVLLGGASSSPYSF